MIKFFFFLMLFVSNLFSEIITIYATESAEYYASGGGYSGCCSPSNLGSYNQSNHSTSHCTWWSQYEQCEDNSRYALWRFDLTEIPENVNIINTSILAQGGGNWIQSFMSISDYTGSISLDMASYLRSGGDWSISGQGVITSPVNQNIPSEITYSGYNSGQLCLMFRFYEGFVTNYGINAPRLVIEWEYDYILGDINSDSIINVLDVIEIINLILNNDYNFIVDMNEDQRIDVLDIIELVNIIINN